MQQTKLMYKPKGLLDTDVVHSCYHHTLLHNIRIYYTIPSYSSAHYHTLLHSIIHFYTLSYTTTPYYALICTTTVTTTSTTSTAYYLPHTTAYYHNLLHSIRHYNYRTLLLSRTTTIMQSYHVLLSSHA